MKLRPYQNQAIEAIRANYVAGINRQLLCMATGAGKTVIFTHLPELLNDILPGKTLILLHRDELAKQAYQQLQEQFPHLLVHIDAGNLHANPDHADVVIASVQTLGREGTKRLDKYDFSKFDKWIVDEAHRSIADSYYNVYNAAGILKESNKTLLLGVTATPTRGDGQGLGTLYDKISFTYELRQAIDEGYLVDICGIKVDTETSLDSVHTKGGDYDQKELAETVNNPARNALVLKSYQQYGNNRHAIGFAVDIKHAQDLAEVFQEAGINADAVWGKDPDRKAKIEAFRKGEIQVLFNAQLLVEGFNVPSIECVILAAPTKSGVVFSQRVGRGTRLFDGKEDLLVLDICDSTSRHTLVTLPTLLGLPSGLNLHGRGLLAVAKELEEKAKELPHLDFTDLDDIENLDKFVEKVNLFEVKFPAEVEQNTEFTWHPSYKGGYVLMLPHKEEVRVQQNLLDKWEISATIKGRKYKGERLTMAEAFSAADTLVRREAPDCLKIVQREAAWHSLPSTDLQIRKIKRLYKGKQIPDNLTRGKAHKLIGAALANKKRK